MADRRLKFYNKQGNPLNFEYVGATAGVPLTYTFNYETFSVNTTPTAGNVSLISLSSNIIYFNVKDLNGFDITSWANSVNEKIQRGGKITLRLSIQPSNIINATIASTSVSGGIVTVNLSGFNGPSIISNSNFAYCETIVQDLPGGYFKGSIFFDPVSAGLYENEQIFILQEFKDSGTGLNFVGFPHTGATGASGSAMWRSRWENDSYGDVDVSNVIFTYQITENDPELGGDPTITNYQNIVFPIIKNQADTYLNGYVSTPEGSTPSRALQVNVAINAPEQGAEVYERKLIIEDITSGNPSKVAEIDFYGQIVGSDERLDVLTRNLGRAFVNEDSRILRNHDPSEPLPDYIEINEKRKELMVAGEDIFPYIGSYKGLIGALKFFGYQDLRIKEYWLNLNYQRVNLSPLQENQIFLDNYNNTKTPNQTVLIADVLDNENTGKYRLEQTYGPNDDGEYVLDVSSENTLVPSRTYKKTSLFGLYYDINTTSTQTDPYGYPVTPEAFTFTQEEVLVKLFALKERLKESYLPLNARIIDITGEGVYYNVFNTKAWTDTVERDEVDSGNNINFIANPDFGFLEDLRAFGTRTDPKSIQAPMNYDNIVDIGVEVIGPSGDAFRFSTGNALNPTISIQRGKQYNFNLISSGYDLYFTTDPSLSQTDPVGVLNNGATSGTVRIDVNPQATGPYYYYSSVNPVKMNGTINITDSPISDFGNNVSPFYNQQRYTAAQNALMLQAIENFYVKKMNGEIKNLGDNLNSSI